MQFAIRYTFLLDIYEPICIALATAQLSRTYSRSPPYHNDMEESQEVPG
jgi:hypothetical protein